MANITSKLDKFIKVAVAGRKTKDWIWDLYDQGISSNDYNAELYYDILTRVWSDGYNDGYDKGAEDMRDGKYY